MHRQPRPFRRRIRSLRERVGSFVRALFGGGSSRDEWSGDAEGGVGVREPRRPLTPSLTGAVALDPPDHEN